MDDITDSNGFTRIFIDSDRANLPARLIVQATGYIQYVQHIDLNEDILPDVIQLELENEEVIEPISSILALSTIVPSLDFEPTMIPIPAGEFIMGSNPDIDHWANNDEQPQHKVYLSDYYISQTEITNTQYEAFVKLADYEVPEQWTTGNVPNGMEDHPIVSVSWEDANAYTKWLSQLTGRNYRLPTEAEWEKACRGLEGTIFPWGDEWDPQRINNFETIVYLPPKTRPCAK